MVTPNSFLRFTRGTPGTFGTVGMFTLRVYGLKNTIVFLNDADMVIEEEIRRDHEGVYLGRI